MKILLTGASGMLGRAIYKSLAASDTDFEITGTAFSRSSDELIKLDLTDSDAVKNKIAELRPDLIIHSAAERRPDNVKNNPAAAEKLNISATQTITEAAEKAGAALLYMSTDYVFDGTAPPYRTEDEPNPLNDYGRMKLEGEIIVLTSCSRPIILRVPILYGEVEALSESAISIIAESIKADEPSFHDDEAIRYPTHTDDVAKVITGIAEKLTAGEELSGIYHWSSESAYTKYGIAKVMADIKEIDPALIRRARPNPDAAPRPMNAHLDTAKTRALGLGFETDFESAIREILNNT